MAAVLQHGLDVWDLRRVSGADLEPLLHEEATYWRDELDWDFERSAALVRKYADMRALHGAALVTNNAVIGYGYSVLEEQKGVIGDLYIRKPYRTAENEYRLLAHVLEELAGTPYVRRVESQLILFGNRERKLPRPAQVQKFDREFLKLTLEDLDRLPAVRLPGIALEPWASHRQDEAAHLIASAYAAHIDALINDQYRSVEGARRFLFNIVQYPGCGNFLPEASLAAFDKDTGRMMGICLASTVGPEVGHITQICLARDARARGLGYEMMRQSLLLMRLHGCRAATLTVTGTNREAIELYRRMGFYSLRSFPDFVWEGF
jgi:ribosomal protein S18 acetylase RimI-like enzyme